MQKKNNTFIALCVIFVVCIFTRIFMLGKIPYAIHIDEAGLLYNIQSLMKFGTDQSGNSWPLLFANYHSEQSAMYTYLAFISCKIFGTTLFAIRIPAVLNMALIFIFGNKLVYKIYNNLKINIIISLLLTFCPYFVLSSRMALDCNLMLGFSTMFLWLFLKAIDTERIKDAVLAGLICGLTLYTYVLSYIALPIFLLTLVIYLLAIKRITVKQIIAFAIPVIILAIPLVLVQVINVFELEEVVLLGITFPNFDSPRHNDIGILSIFTNLLTPLLYILFTPQRLYECIFVYGNFQWILAPFLIIGIVSNLMNMFKKKTILWKNILIIFWISVYITCTLVHKDLTTWHLNGLMFISVLFIFDGMKAAFLKIKEKNTKIFLAVIVLLLFIIPTGLFLNYYYVGNYDYDEANSYYVYDDLSSVLNYVDTITDADETVYVLLPSLIYRVENDISYFEPESVYVGTKEAPIEIDGYIFDMGAKILQNPDPNAIYIVGNCYEDYRRVLDELNLETITIDAYTVYGGGIS